jgi:hypothetical protein
MSDTGEEMLSTRQEAFARIPKDQRFTWKISPQPGRLLFADTVGGTLIALKDIFKSVGDELGEPQVVSILDAKFDEDGGLSIDLVVMPKRPAAEEPSNG